jgi:hypothetical protein
MERSPKVVFDWTGALRAARLSWQAADDVERLIGERGRLASDALVNWSGAYATEFAARVDDELQTAAAVAGQLRGEAEGWAIEWKNAMDQENWNRYQAACDRVRDDRGLIDKVMFWQGHDDLPPEPSMAAVPRAPGFVPTRQFANYSGY